MSRKTRKPQMLMVVVVCQQCGLVQQAPHGTVWPAMCRQCPGDIAPRWWFRERNLQLHKRRTA